MVNTIAALVRRVTDVAGSAATAARWAAAVYALAAVVMVAVFRLEPASGFGWAFPGWWLPALLTLGPAVVVFLFSVSAAKLAALVEEWPDRLSVAAATGIDVAAEVAGSTRTAIAHRRGFVKLASGVWGLRKVALSARGLFGDAAPALAAFSPSYLLLTAVAIAAGVMLTVAAASLVMLRIVL